MSIEAVEKFLIRVKENQELQEEVAQAVQEENHREAVVELAAKHGFDFTPEELGNKVKNSLATGTLTEEELTAICGGRGGGGGGGRSGSISHPDWW